ncbi:MAG: HDOD domain-containing protein [Neptuniibacter sp.]
MAVLAVFFKKLFRKKSQVEATRSVSKPKAPYATPEEISRLFISTILDEKQYDRFSNEIDEQLNASVTYELNNFDVDSIPKLADTSIKLMEKLISPNVPSSEIVNNICQDPVLMGKLLQLANSPFYRISPNEIESLEDAVVLLGNDGIRKMVISSLLSSELKISSAYFKFFGANIWRHSHEVAELSAIYASRNGANEFKAYLNGLLHDVGKLIIFKLLINVLEKSPPRHLSFNRIFQTTTR